MVLEKKIIIEVNSIEVQSLEMPSEFHLKSISIRIIISFTDSNFLENFHFHEFDTYEHNNNV